MDSQGSKSSPISSTNFDIFNTQLQGAALKATRNALALPPDLAFHRSMDPAFARDLDAFSSRVLSVANNILALVSTADSSQSARGKGKSRLKSQDDVVDNFSSLVVDSVDQLLERVDICLDEHLGRTQPPAIVVNPPNAARKQRSLPKGWLDPALQHASHLPKPQLSFKKKPNNGADLPWYPTLSHKYNAQVPLGYEYLDADKDSDATGDSLNTHPYLYEITHISYPTRMFRPAPPIPPLPFDKTPFTWVATATDLSTMLENLRNATEVAVDLEHHSYRTYSGFLCLMQISTREQDWVIDTLVLRDELEELNEIFTDPNIVKVFHGAKSDILWLQQDFNLYVVNLFDTYHASKVLDFPRHGLASLLEMYCDFTPDKRYQLADWRIRPLPQEMLLYARSDTHFLLYIYDNLRNALLDRARSLAESSSQPQIPPTTLSISNSTLDASHSLLREVLARSTETALCTYQPQSYDAEGGSGNGGWDSLVRKWNKGSLLEGPQKNLFLAVHAWRDQVARDDDESTRYVLPDHHLLRLVERPPSDMATLVSLFQPIPPVVRRRARELLDVIKNSVSSSRGSSISTARATETKATAIAVENAILPAVAPDADPNTSGLWSRTSRRGNATATSSSLFGSTLSPSSKTSISYSTSQSSLFGDLKRATPAIAPISQEPNSVCFRDLVARIHSTLVVAPSAPKISNTLTEQETIAADVDVALHSTDTSEAPAIEIPFIPASQRQTTRNVVEDSIVVVGQPKLKKRKRPKTSPPTPLGADPSSSTDIIIGESAEGVKKMVKGRDLSAEAATLEPFDFSTAPNILDDVPQVDQDSKQWKRKRQKRQDGGALEYGHFPAPPRSHRDLKSGNQSHTFK